MEQKGSLFKNGLKDGFPIGLGYFPIAFTLGIGASESGISLVNSLLMAVLSFTGVGQITTMDLMKANERYTVVFLTLLVINLRNIVLSLSMATKLDKKVSLPQKLILAMGNTDEIFALTIRKEGKIPFNYFLGVMTVPYIAWFLGTLIGGVAGDILPKSIISAMAMALYAMLISSIVPAAKESKPILYVAIVSGLISCIMQWVNDAIKSGVLHLGPVLEGILQPGGIIVIGSILSAVLVAWKFPTKVEEDE